MGINRTLGIVPFDPPRNRGHRFDRFNGKVPNRGFIREHYRVGSIQDRVSHITHLRSGGSGA